MVELSAAFHVLLSGTGIEVSIHGARAHGQIGQVERRMSSVSVEELAVKLVNLANKPTLSKAENEEVRRSMKLLKKAGMTNQEISELTGGKWSESTIKGYTTGVKATDPSPWQDAVGLLNDLMSMGMCLNDVDTAVTIGKDLKSWGVTLEEVASFLLLADSSSTDLGTLLQQNKELKECGLSPKAVGEALSLVNELHENGLSLNSLPTLVRVAGSYGEPEKVLEAVSVYGSLGEIESEVSMARKELENLVAHEASLHQQMEGAQADLAELENLLRAYHKVSELGFGEEELVELSNLAERFGGPRAVLKGFRAYADYSEISDKVTKAKKEVNNVQARINELNAEYDHLKAAIGLCDSLIYKQKLGLDAIGTLVAIAKKYGEPMGVLKAVETYGNIKTMEDKVEELEGKIHEREKLLHWTEGQYQAALEQLGSLNASSVKAGAEVGKLESRLQESKELHGLVILVNDPVSADYSEFGPVVVALVVAVLKWVKQNERRFGNVYGIKLGLESLIKQLGGE